MCVYISVIKDESDCTAINDCPTPSYILITNATTKHTLRRQTINQCPWASRDR